MSRAPYSYRVYGLSLRSPLTLPCRRRRVGSLPRLAPDVDLRAGTDRAFASARPASAIDPPPAQWFQSSTLASGATYLQWRGLFEFIVSRDGRRIGYRRLEHATDESFNVYLLGQVLSFSLVRFGLEPLHGTVVVVDGEAVAFVGDCGMGKSTLAAAFVARGGRVLTDDVIALDERPDRWLVHAGIPRLKLFPHVAASLLGRGARGAPMNHATAKLVLPLDRAAAAARPLRLKALYVLGDGEAPAPGRQPGAPTHGGRSATPQIVPLSGSEAFLEVVRAAFNLVVLEPDRLANQFAFATRLSATVPIRRLTYPRRLAALPRVCDAVLADVRALS